VHTYALGTVDKTIPDNDPHARVVVEGGAPSAIALSGDESTAFVYARSTNDLMSVRLGDRVGKLEHSPIPFVHLTDDTLSKEAVKGKRLFYDANDFTMSGGLACAGCHPDGRDDGFVWGELGSAEQRSFHAVPISHLGGNSELGVPRQTPMLAGRVTAIGPYGWHAESKTLEDRIRDGFGIHRWSGGGYLPTMDRPKAIATFLREGLVAPPHDDGPLTDEEKRGKEVFESDATGCTTCHASAHEFTDRTPRELPRKAEVYGFFTEKERAFKTPSLLFVGGTPPYFHDGRAKNLDEVIELNGDVMGHTSGLSHDDRGALVAYLKRL
jgi:cytochrome c peroxidase